MFVYSLFAGPRRTQAEDSEQPRQRSRPSARVWRNGQFVLPVAVHLADAVNQAPSAIQWRSRLISGVTPSRTPAPYLKPAPLLFQAAQAVNDLKFRESEPALTIVQRRKNKKLHVVVTPKTLAERRDRGYLSIQIPVPDHYTYNIASQQPHKPWRQPSLETDDYDPIPTKWQSRTAFPIRIVKEASRQPPNPPTPRDASITNILNHYDLDDEKSTVSISTVSETRGYLSPFSRARMMAGQVPRSHSLAEQTPNSTITAAPSTPEDLEDEDEEEDTSTPPVPLKLTTPTLAECENIVTRFQQWDMTLAFAARAQVACDELPIMGEPLSPRSLPKPPRRAPRPSARKLSGLYELAMGRRIRGEAADCIQTGAGSEESMPDFTRLRHPLPPPQPLASQLPPLTISRPALALDTTVAPLRPRPYPLPIQRLSPCPDFTPTPSPLDGLSPRPWSGTHMPPAVFTPTAPSPSTLKKPKWFQRKAPKSTIPPAPTPLAAPHRTSKRFANTPPWRRPQSSSGPSPGSLPKPRFLHRRQLPALIYTTRGISPPPANLSPPETSRVQVITPLYKRLTGVLSLEDAVRAHLRAGETAHRVLVGLLGPRLPSDGQVGPAADATGGRDGAVMPQTWAVHSDAQATLAHQHQQFPAEARERAWRGTKRKLADFEEMGTKRKFADFREPGRELGAKARPWDARHPQPQHSPAYFHPQHHNPHPNPHRTQQSKRQSARQSGRWEVRTLTTYQRGTPTRNPTGNTPLFSAEASPVVSVGEYRFPADGSVEVVGGVEGSGMGRGRGFEGRGFVSWF